MIDACELIIHSSLERKESRGPFFRRDFPLTDNANWLVANVLKKSGNGMKFEQRTYDLPIFRPGFCHQGQSRGRVVTSAPAPTTGMDARRLGQIEMGDTLAARNSRLSRRRQDRCADLPLRWRRRAGDVSGFPGAVSEMDAGARCSQLDRRERSDRSRLSMVLRLQDVRDLRGSHERT